MKQSLKNAGDAVVVNPAALDDIEGSNLPVRPGSGNLPAVGQAGGEISRRDLIIPRLQISQSVGDLYNLYGFAPGSIVLNHETLIADPGEELTLIVAGIQKSYEENLKYQKDGPLPRRFATEVELKAAGLHCNWGPKGSPQPPAREVADVLVLVQKPADLDPVKFGIIIDSEAYTAAQWTMRSTAYSRAAKAVFSALALDLRADGLLAGKWTLKTNKVQINGNYTFVPELRLTGRVTKEVQEQIRAALS